MATVGRRVELVDAMLVEALATISNSTGWVADEVRLPNLDPVTVPLDARIDILPKR